MLVDTPKRNMDQKKKNKLKSKTYIKKIINLFKKSSRPLVIAGNGVHQSNTSSDLKKLILKAKVPLIFSRFGQDLFSHDDKYIFVPLPINKIDNNKDMFLIKNESTFFFQFTFN